MKKMENRIRKIISKGIGGEEYKQRGTKWETKRTEKGSKKVI